MAARKSKGRSSAISAMFNHAIDARRRSKRTDCAIAIGRHKAAQAPPLRRIHAAQGIGRHAASARCAQKRQSPPKGQWPRAIMALRGKDRRNEDMPKPGLFGGQKLGHIMHGGAVTGATFAAAQGSSAEHEGRAMKAGTMFACQAAVAGNGKGAALAATKRRHLRRQAGARIMLVIAQNKADMPRLCGQCGAPIGLALRVAEHINYRRVHHE